MGPRAFSKRNRVLIIILAAAVLVALAGIFVLHEHGNKEKNARPAAAAEQASQANPPSQQETPPVQPKVLQVAPAPAPALPAGTDRFVISLTDTNATIEQNLLAGNYITDADAFDKILGSVTLAPGGYKISSAMTPAQLAQVLEGKPYMKWVVIPPGLRKEEIAALLANALGWTPKETSDWINKDTASDPDYTEGVYFPDTYLIPLSETPTETADRLIAMFNQEFAPYLLQFNAQNIKWTTGLTLASIVQREAANDADMPLIAGILWNRLEQGMPLDVDATVQYARGDTPDGWWAPITPADEQIDSPYNTYLYKGLPPHPISNPGLPAIDAVLEPATTDCLYYIHDANRVTHCAATYAEQEANIETYLTDQNQPASPAAH